MTPWTFLCLQQAKRRREPLPPYGMPDPSAAWQGGYHKHEWIPDRFRPGWFTCGTCWSDRDGTRGRDS